MLVYSFLLALSWPQDEAIFTHAPGRYLDLLLGILISWRRHLQPIGTWQEVSEGELSLGIRHRRQPKLMQCDQCANDRSEEHTSELQSRLHLVCRLLLEKKKKHKDNAIKI